MVRTAYRSFSNPNSQDDFFDGIRIHDKHDAIVSVQSANDEPKVKKQFTGEVEYLPTGSVDPSTFIHSRQTEQDYSTRNPMQYDQKFMDKVRVWAFGGRGGQGACAFSKENYMAKVPDGGSGGHGGAVIFKANQRITSLHDLRRAHFKGNNGKQGKGKQRNG